MELISYEKAAISKYISAIEQRNNPKETIEDCRMAIVHILQSIYVIDLKLPTSSEKFIQVTKTVMKEKDFFGHWDKDKKAWTNTDKNKERVCQEITDVFKERNNKYEPEKPSSSILDETDVAAKVKNSTKLILKWYYTHHHNYKLIDFAYLSSKEIKTIEHLFPGKIDTFEENGTQIIEQEQKGMPIPEEKENVIFKKPEESVGGGGKTKGHVNRNVLHLFGGLIIISLALVVYLLLKSNEKPQEAGFPITIVPEDTRDSTKPQPTKDTQGTTITTINPPKEKENIKKEEEGKEPITDTMQKGLSNYISNNEFRNKEGSNEMAVLIINSNNTNADITPKVASVFLKNMGYINTASLFSREFVTDGLFEKIFNGGKFDFTKYNFKDYADYFCLGKINIESGQSDDRQDMTKATINLEMKVIKTTNGGVVNQFTVPYPYNIGAGFSKQQAVEVATNNIITYLKNYKYEN